MPSRRLPEEVVQHGHGPAGRKALHRGPRDGSPAVLTMPSAVQECLLADNCRLLAKNLGGELDNRLIAGAARDMPAASGSGLLLTASKLGASAGKGRPTAALGGRWSERQGGVLDESALADRIVGLLGERIPPAIGAALRAEAARFGGGGDRGNGRVSASRDDCPGGQS